MDLTDEQWFVIRTLIPDPFLCPDGKSRPWRDAREVLNGILGVLRTGALWHDLPERYPPYQTCHRRFQQWVRSGILERILKTLAADLRKRGGLDRSECCIDGTFITTKNVGKVWKRPSGEKVLRSWQLQTALVFLSPPALHQLHRMKSPLLQQLSPNVLSLMSNPRV